MRANLSIYKPSLYFNHIEYTLSPKAYIWFQEWCVQKVSDAKVMWWSARIVWLTVQCSNTRLQMIQGTKAGLQPKNKVNRAMIVQN